LVAFLNTEDIDKVILLRQIRETFFTLPLTSILASSMKIQEIGMEKMKRTAIATNSFHFSFVFVTIMNIKGIIISLPAKCAI
jgi:hypothetical protein